MVNELVKLNIQLLADDASGSPDQTTVDPTTLEQLGEQVKIIGQAIKASLDIIYKEVKELNENAGFKGEAGDVLKEVMESFAPEFEKYEATIANLGTFLIGVAQVFLASDKEMLGEITAWGETAKSVIQQIKGGLNSQVEKGSITPESYVQQMTGSLGNIKSEVINISSATRGITTELGNMFLATGDAVKSTTGKNLVEIGSEAIGTAKTLFNFAGENAGSSIITSLFNTLGDGLGLFLGQK
ncbi:MAG: hypothetical protein IJO33_01075 [Bacilli bacterium]|nr:hypothetical protein [Bacilli bacterium]